MTCIIIDDEPLAREELSTMISELSDLTILKTFSSAPDSLEFLLNHEVDIVFLDIIMPDITGLEFIKEIPRRSMVIFTTAFSEYALESYELDAIDYLLKPFSDERLIKSIEKAQYYKNLSSDGSENVITKNNSTFLLIKSEKRLYKINYEDILYIEGLKDYVIIHTINQKIVASLNLKTTHQKIPLSEFIRVSKSFVVNVSHITSFDNRTIYIEDTEIPIGDVYRDEFNNYFDL